jgi:hypothetical protein
MTDHATAQGIARTISQEFHEWAIGGSTDATDVENMKRLEKRVTALPHVGAGAAVAKP